MFYFYEKLFFKGVLIVILFILNIEPKVLVSLVYIKTIFKFFFKNELTTIRESKFFNMALLIELSEQGHFEARALFYCGQLVFKQEFYDKNGLKC